MFSTGRRADSLTTISEATITLNLNCRDKHFLENAKMHTEHVILHFVQINGAGEKLCIVESPATESDRTPPAGYKLYGEHPADIEQAHILPVGRILDRSEY
jgi:hypothetical protein